MSPVENQPQCNVVDEQSLPAPPPRIEVTQPRVSPPMDPQRPHTIADTTPRMRGGDRSRCCPGRFCFCVPCPLPCDCCII
ncbi:hypothetical protein KVR01_003897 [Diaporthe batatas]|uniref:uncharacterized protein n=1 Tax=Diaporthe batatas TaxID=748121 RepID=UPI001D03E512|nr:uncharacterized protein KVR01_003897 [Diaporthe batatas]KAG8168208.1 hypothetical protein KVR01_003897 [Diaporthe batatas]